VPAPPAGASAAGSGETKHNDSDSRLASVAKHHLVGASLRGGLFLIWPVVLVLGLCGAELTDLLFGRGEFSPADTAATAASLRIRALGLLPAFASRLLTPVFYARRRPSLLAYATVLQLGSYALLGAPLLRSHGHVGLALASTLALAAYALALGVLACRVDKTLTAALSAQGLPLLKQVAAALTAAGITLLVLPGITAWPSWARLSAVTFCAGTTYLGLVTLVDADIRRALLHALQRARSRS
jgi:putative peptidoglycan lipid II flippase